MQYWFFSNDPTLSYNGKYREMWIVFHSYPGNFKKIMFQETSNIFES